MVLVVVVQRLQEDKVGVHRTVVLVFAQQLFDFTTDPILPRLELGEGSPVSPASDSARSSTIP